MNRLKCAVCRGDAARRGELDFGGARVPYTYCERHYKQYIVGQGLASRVVNAESSAFGFRFTVQGMTILVSRVRA